MLARRYGVDPSWRWTGWRALVDGHLAEVRLRDLPGHLGVSVRYTPLGRPAILLDQHLTNARRLFTLAHEVGHICLGWHRGTATCGETDVFSPRAAAEEAEANAFAAELLVPEFWLQRLISNAGLPDAIDSAYRLSSASPTTVSLQLARTLHPGWVFVQLDRETHEVRYRGQSPGTDANLPSIGNAWDAPQAVGPIESWEYRPVGWSRIVWLRYPTSSPLAAPTVEPASAILRRILEDLPPTPEGREHLIHSVNGVCGAAKNRVEPGFTAEEMAALLWQRIDARPKLRDVAAHPEFERFVSQKARELAL